MYIIVYIWHMILNYYSKRLVELYPIDTTWN